MTWQRSRPTNQKCLSELCQLFFPVVWHGLLRPGRARPVRGVNSFSCLAAAVGFLPLTPTET